MNLKKSLIFILNKLQTPLLLAILFLGPNQLAYHIWPEWSLIYGIRIDYLSIKIYLTELLIVVYVLLSAFINFSKIKNCFRLNYKYILLLIYFAINLFISKIPIASFVYLFQITTFILFARNLINIDINKKTMFVVFNAIFISLVFFGTLGIIQFLKGSTIGGPFYYLGERNFNTNSINIALVDVLGRLMLRAYSTFSHPNSMAGYFVTMWFLLAAINLKKLSSKKYLLGNLIIFIAFILTFSKTAILALLCVFVFYFFSRVFPKALNLTKHVSIAVILISLGLLLISTNLNIDKNFIQKNLLERIELVRNTKEIIEDNLVFGVGVNNYIYSLANLKSHSKWILQPVHNTYLLLFSEMGIVGLVFLYIFLQKILNKLEKKNTLLLMGFLTVLITGFADHYWLTLIQNQFALAVYVAFIYKIDGQKS